MGIWIRSQDKKCLVKTQESWITKGKSGEFIINISNNSFKWYTVGIYSTKEKAITVLDMIQKQIEMPIHRIDAINGEISSHKDKIFQMPQDNEVVIDG